jgi:tRNA nucleotidyltransferase (CCA-adding enzyme)
VSEVSTPPPADDGAVVLERLRAVAGGPQLLALAATRTDAELVGGAVRDLLLGGRPRELDVVVARDAAGFARELAAALHATVTEHTRFGTAVVEGVEARADIATRRAERYARPGALPEVREGTPHEDLLRRDFTVNAIAVALGGPRRGELRHVPHALEDLRAGRLRVLHERSFLDDPTRLLRLARYGARLGFAVEGRTDRLADAAVAAGALASLSGARLGAELRLALRAVWPIMTLALLDERGVLRAVHPRLRLDERLVAAALELLPDTARLDLLLLAAIAVPLVLGAEDDARVDDAPRGAPAAGVERAAEVERAAGAERTAGAELAALLDRLEFPRADRDLALAAALAAVRLARELPSCERPSQVHALAAPAPLEGVALAGALGGHGNGRTGASEIARRWLSELRHVRLRIAGEDLLAAGVPEGPEVGRRLRATLALRLDGEIAPGREAELRAAVRLP